MSDNKEVAIPDYLKAMIADGQVEDQTSSMQEASGSVPRLTTKGKIFRFKDGDADEVKAGQSVDLIILGMNPPHGLAHTYYRDGYTPDSSSPPDCSSNNGVTPDVWIQNPEHSNCQKCPQQVWGSAQSMSGGKAKACKDHKQLFVARAEDFGKDPENCTVYLTQVTVNSLKAFASYGKELASKGIPGPQFVITTFSFDEENSVPKVEYTLRGVLNENLGKAAHARNQKAEWDAGSALPPPSRNESKRELPNMDADDPGISDADIIVTDNDSVDDLIDNW